MTISGAKPLSTLKLLSLTEEVAYQISHQYPLVSEPDLHNDLVNVILRHHADFQRLSQRKARWVLTRFSIRFAANRRSEHFARTDHFVYWPSEIALAKSDMRDFEGIAEYRVQAVRRHEWGLDPAIPENTGQHIPSWAHGRRIADYLIAVLDVQLAMKTSEPGRTQTIAPLCDVLNKHNKHCALHAEELTK